MNRCTCDSPSIVAVIDKNLDNPFTSGNKFCRFCKGCKRRKFCSEAWFDKQDDTYAIPEGKEDELVNYFECPQCDDDVTGTPEHCPNCDTPFGWDD